MKRFFSTLFLAIFAFTCFSQSIVKNIVIDQFGYRPHDAKVAIIRNPKVGYDASETYTPGTTFQVINLESKQVLFEGSIDYKTSGESDSYYGDEVWWFDFSSVQEPGTYYIFDGTNNTRSYSFKIAEDVYNSVLKDAARMFFYQRAGHEKKSKYAGSAWADGASHVGYKQDKECRLFSDLKSTKSKDVHGGWYDAGDYNKYTTWGCNYVENLLSAYLENPEIWTDDFNIPESGNGIPDILDEVKWEMDWILRMQNEDGSVLCVVNLPSGTPPSSVTAQTAYGPATTNASYAAAKAFAIGYLTYKDINKSYAETLYSAAITAWNWAEANPAVEFYNAQNSVAAGEQEGGEEDRLVQRLSASLYLYEMTGEKNYLTVFESNYTKLRFFKWYNYFNQYQQIDQLMLLHYITMDNVSETIQNKIRTNLKAAILKSGDFEAMRESDSYRSYTRHYNWGSNSHKCFYGIMYYLFAEKDLCSDTDEYKSIAEDYIHYIHGVNPFAMVYLTNMNEHGASNSVNQMYHSWFCNGSSEWDDVRTSLYGPAPGYLIGGPYGFESNGIQTYTWDGCCPNNCGSNYNNSLCNSSLLFPENEPFAKRYNDFNDSWPMNSWEITEPSCGYQVNYIRLLSKFVAKSNTNPSSTENITKQDIQIYPNPAKDYVTITTENTDEKNIKLIDMQSHVVKSIITEQSSIQIDLRNVPIGIYLLQIFNGGNLEVREIVVSD